MILAAGEGRRMRPLTEHTPKPLLKVGEFRLIEHHILRLKAAGINQIIINVAYLGQQIIDALGDGKNYGVAIVYSVESEQLETGGALDKALPLLTASNDMPFLLVNSDVWTNFDFKTLTDLALDSQQDGCLVFVDNPEHNVTGDFLLQKNDDDALNPMYVVEAKNPSDMSSMSYTFSGISLLHPRLITSYPHRREKFPLKEVFDHAIENRRIIGIPYGGDWVDIGTPERLHAIRQRFDSISTPRAC